MLCVLSLVICIVRYFQKRSFPVAVSYTILILEEGNQTYPRFPKCYMFVSHNDLNVRHVKTACFL